MASRGKLYAPFTGVLIHEDFKKFNQEISSLRISVEWRYPRVVCLCLFFYQYYAVAFRFTHLPALLPSCLCVRILQYWQAILGLSFASDVGEAPSFWTSAGDQNVGRSHYNQRPHMPVWKPDGQVSASCAPCLVSPRLNCYGKSDVTLLP